MKTTTPPPTRTAAEIDSEILRPIDPWRMTRFLQSRAIDLAIAQAQRTIDLSLQSAFFPFDADLAAVASDLGQRADTTTAQLLASLLAIRHVLDQCPEAAAAEKELGPIYDEWQARKVAESEAARLQGIAENARRAAMEKAKAQAIAEIEQRFAS
jgi:hypothetical protein